MARTNHQRTVPIVLFVLAVALLAGRIAVQAMKTDAKAAGLVHWMTPEEGALALRVSKRPVLYDFTAEWCGPCHMLDAEVFNDRQMAAYINENFIAVRVMDRQQEDGRNPPAVEALQQRYTVNGFPTVVVADAQGNERARMEGFRGRDEFGKMMENLR